MPLVAPSQNFPTFSLWKAFLFFALLAAQRLAAQTQSGFMYGRISTQSNTYEGQLRWGQEEACWTDYFNVLKREPTIYKKLVPCAPKKDDDFWPDLDWDIESIWKDKTEAVRQFNCQFGDLKALKVMGNSRAKVQFKNGMELEVLGEGYNDLGTKVQVVDKELGLTAINWEKIDKVEFLPCPRKLPIQMGEPLFGTVESTRREKFTGFLQWDHDERFGADKLDGFTADGKISISFSDIASIERKGHSCLVVLNSGRELTVSGSNDVNSENRGLFIVIPEKGLIDMNWAAFKKVTFSKKGDTGPSYDNFLEPKQLSGRVNRFSEGELSGRLVFDLDESLDLETLEGHENGLSYTIPFRNIRRITPKNRSFSQVELRSGETLLLSGSNDVNEGNSGIIVIQKGKKEPVYVPWDNIDQITFD